MQASISVKSFIGAAIGTLIEYYDYALFAVFLPILSPVFFSATSDYQALVKGYFVLFITMLARPIGGITFGYIGDMVGRKKALLGSMYGIAIATLIIGITPSHQSIGFWAPIIIVIAKAVQLFCFGGEYNGSGIYVVEHAQKSSESLLGSLLTAMTLFGALIATLMGILVTLTFMPAWAWRITFLLGGLVGVFGILYRKKMSESPNFQKADLKLHSLKSMFQQYRAELIAGIFIGGFATLPFTTVLTFINPVLTATHFFTPNQLMILQSFLVFIAILTLVLSGKIADRLSPGRVMKFGAILLMILSFPLLYLIDTRVVTWIVLSQVCIIIINEILLGPSNAYLKNLFAMQYRYRAASFSFCLGMSVFGGLTPIVENAIYEYTGNFGMTAIWLVFIGIGTFVSLIICERKQQFTNVRLAVKDVSSD